MSKNGPFTYDNNGALWIMINPHFQVQVINGSTSVSSLKMISIAERSGFSMELQAARAESRNQLCQVVVVPGDDVNSDEMV